MKTGDAGADGAANMDGIRAGAEEGGGASSECHDLFCRDKGDGGAEGAGGGEVGKIGSSGMGMLRPTSLTQFLCSDPF